MKGKIFTAQEVQAIIAGNMTMFREVCKRQPQGEMEQPYVIRQAGITEFNYPFGKIPYQVGQKIFCKEAFATSLGDLQIEDVKYSTDQQKLYGFPFREDWKNRPAQHMKQEHSRLTLLIKEIRVERLQDISEENLKLEGFKTYYKIMNDGIYKKDSIKFFREDWNATHKKPEEKFEANPFVFVYTTEVVK